MADTDETKPLEPHSADKAAPSADGAEPSMEDILSSIRRILSEEGDNATGTDDADEDLFDDAGTADKPVTDAARTSSVGESAQGTGNDDSALLTSLTADGGGDGGFAASPDPGAASGPAGVASALGAATEAGLPPEPVGLAAAADRDPLATMAAATVSAASGAAAAMDPEIRRRGSSRDGEVLELTPAMRVWPDAAMVSSPAAEASTDVLAQLAKAILDRRDVGIGNRDATLEGIVREMLRPLLKEWLDRNLPYLIERLVKREIDRMINRAERLED